MNDITQGFSQFLYTYGPGAMLDLPAHAVIMSGLDDWPMQDQDAREIEESRLAELLVRSLPDRFQAHPRFLTPPPYDTGTQARRRPVPVRLFPEWFVSDETNSDESDEEQRTARTTRPMIPYERLEPSGQKPLEYAVAGGKAKKVNPVRFVAACRDGHLRDIDWRRVVHQRGGDLTCRQSLRWTEKGVSSDPGAIAVRCDCGAQVTLADLHAPGFLGTCDAFSPWLSPRRQEGDTCGEGLRLLSRTATNAYFPQSVSVISLPVEDDKVVEALRGNWAYVEGMLNLPNRVDVLRAIPPLRSALLEHSDTEIEEAIERARVALSPDALADPRVEEFDRLAPRQGPIGRDGANSRLFGERLDHAKVGAAPISRLLLSEIVMIHRLREVACLYGFTRLEPAPTALESELDDITLATRSAALSRSADWLPAAERFGEGIFLRFNPDSISDWAERMRATARLSDLRTGEIADATRFRREPQHRGVAYWALHSLAHAVMSDLALRSGYPLSSLKERIYASKTDAQPRFGILVYTATAGGQGTLGGLSRNAELIPEILEGLLDSLDVCSNDPICEDHRPGRQHDEDALLGAACHACLLVPETSCEARNGRLDRALLINDDATGLLQWKP